jgi:two-component system sensor histidine kinase VicK
MLDVARLESGKAEYQLEPLDIISTTKTVVDMQAIPAQTAHVQIVYNPPAKLSPVLADKNKLQIILTNFVSNAIKYNRSGGTITIQHSSRDNKLITSVADTGLGIPTDQQSHIFEKFYRVKHADRVNVPGTGLGMYITKHFIESMGGEIWFTSTHGQGTTFYFSLPYASAESIGFPAVKAKDTNGHTIGQQPTTSSIPAATQ